MWDAPNKNGYLDPVPNWIMKEFVRKLSPSTTTLCNASVGSGILTSTQMCALVTQVLKKSNHDPTIQLQTNFKSVILIKDAGALCNWYDKCILHNWGTFTGGTIGLWKVSISLMPSARLARDLHGKLLSTEIVILLKFCWMSRQGKGHFSDNLIGVRLLEQLIMLSC